MYKMVNITKETHENDNIEVRVDSANALWLNERHIGEQLRHKHLPAVTSKYDKIYNKHRYELVDKPIKQPYRRFLRIDLALKITMDCRTDESCNLIRNLGFTSHDVINSKEQTIINSIKNAFEGEDLQKQYTVIGYRIDLYFHEYKLAIEVDELGHNDRNIDYKIQRQKALEKELNCVFIRINCDEKDFNTFKEINKIHPKNHPKNL